MKNCAEKDSEIVELLRNFFNEITATGPPIDDLSLSCRILEIIKSTYGCLEDSIYDNCGHEATLSISKIRINLMKFAVEEGCSMCA